MILLEKSELSLCVCFSCCLAVWLVQCPHSMQDRNVDLQREGIKMTVASEQPYLLALDEDAFGTGVVLYHLQVQ